MQATLMAILIMIFIGCLVSYAGLRRDMNKIDRIEARKDRELLAAAKLPDPYDTAYPIVTAGQVLDGLSAELQMFLGPAGLPCPKAWTKGNHTWQLRRNPGPSYYWKCGSCPATTDEKTLPLLQGWEPTPREVVQFTGRPLPPRKTTAQYLRDLDASLELEFQQHKQETHREIQNAFRSVEPSIEIETFGQIGTRVYNGSTWL